MNAFLTPMSLSSYPLLHYLGALRVPKGGFWDPVGWFLGPSKAQMDQRFLRVRGVLQMENQGSCVLGDRKAFRALKSDTFIDFRR